MNRTEKKRLESLMDQFSHLLEQHCHEQSFNDYDLLFAKFHNVIFGRTELFLFPHGRIPVGTLIPPVVDVHLSDEELDDIERGELIYSRIHNKC